jgi:hypothetical protein
MRRIGFLMAVIGVCGLVFAGGCAKHAKSEKAAETKPAVKEIQKPTGKPVDLMAKFVVGDMSNYKVATETIKDYKFEQPSINQTKTQQTLTRTEVVFDQQIQGVDPSGDASALITIKELKYLATNPKGTAIDFDSTKEANKTNALAKLIGESYVVKLSPDGSVLSVSDAQKAMDAVKGDTMEQKIAQSLLADDAIKQRHTILALPEKKDAQVRVGQTWSKLKGSPAGMLTPKSYEEVFTLKEVKSEQGQQIAVVEMEARPTSQKAADTSKDEQKGMGFFAKMFDNKETYNGKTLVDLTTGKVNGYNEKLKSEWVAVEPSEEVKSDKGPDVLTMGFTYSHSIEKVK